MTPDPQSPYMQRAIALARQGEGLTRPNPPVGAVLVKNQQIIGEGWHQKAGTPHAEIHALNAAGTEAKGADIYITLEPCSSTGKTPPCTQAIIQAGIKNVIYGCTDPDPRHAGKGLELLKQHGITVTPSSFKEDCQELIAPFAKRITTGLPYVTLKMATTLDGRIADRSGKSQWITGPESRERVQALRRQADAIMVGTGTAIKDNPSLLPRPSQGRTPWRVVVGNRPLPPTLNLFSDDASDQTIRILLGEDKAPAKNSIHCTSLGEGLEELAKREIMHVVCEGGGRLAGSLLAAGLVDEWVWFTAPSVLGDTGLPALSGVSWLMEERPNVEVKEVATLGQDVLWRLKQCLPEL